MCSQVYSPYLRRVVPISYSSPTALTSIIWQSKNEHDRQWLLRPLASLLHHFLQEHWPCLERAAGGSIDAIVPIPSHIDTRGGVDHLRLLHDVLRSWHPMEWNFGLLEKTSVQRAEDRRRTVALDQFTAYPWEVSGKRILLIDDLYTSGGTIASAAAALVGAGADRPVAVTIGRQLKADSYSADLVKELDVRGWEPDSCAIEPPRLLRSPSRVW